MKKIITILLFLLSMGIYAQEKGSIGIEFNVNYDLVNTAELNTYLDRVLLDLPDNKTLLSRNKIEHGMDYGLKISYQFSRLFNIGIYSKYSTAKSLNDTRIIIPASSWLGEPADTIQGVDGYHQTNTIVGIYTDFFINHLSFWPTEKWLSKLESKVTVGMGYSFSKFIVTGQNNLWNGFPGEVNPVSGLHLMGNLKIGYKLSQKSVFSSIGIQVGYQLLMTKRIKGALLLTFKDDDTPNLNFSGLTTGIYLTFGK